MNLKEFLIHLLKEDAPDEEQSAGQLPSQAAPSAASRNSGDSEKVANDPSPGDPNLGTNDDEDIDSEQDNDQEYDDKSLEDDLDTQPRARPRGIRSILSRIWSSIFPSPSDEEEIQAYIPHYRVLPIISGIAIPFCILLEIPGLTEHWYIHTEGSTIIAAKPNPPWIDAGIALSILCAVLANLCLVIRFLEIRIKTMTILCALFLSLHGRFTFILLLRKSTTIFRYYQRCCS